jgi:hypothetical protein
LKKTRCRAAKQRLRAKIRVLNRTIKKLNRQITRCTNDSTPSPSPTPTQPPTQQGYLIVDHRAVAEFNNIPDQWLQAAKELTLHYAHTSHGSQIVSGLNYLEQHVDGTKYSFAHRENGNTAGLPPVESPPAFRMYDGNPPETYIEPGDYWASENGKNRTRTVAETGSYNYSMWSWCGQQSNNDIETVNTYLSTMSGFESEYPTMRFIYMTGHTDGGSSKLVRNNQMVRDYVIANNKILFDFADIESWDPDGNYYPNTSDNCDWCSNWCANHLSDCQNLPSCSHSHGFNCVQKGKAFWWMMAKLAGWQDTE